MKQHAPVSTAPTTALQFEEFSYWDSDGFMTCQDIPEKHHRDLRAYLFEHYGAVDILEVLPFLVIGCKDGPPQEDSRPFSIAGAIAIWRDAHDMSFKPVVGDSGQADNIEIDQVFLDKINPLQVPPREVILYLVNDIFPTCEAISVLWETLVVELPTVNDAEHYLRLNSLPRDIECCPLFLRFHNGPLPNTKRGKQVFKVSLQSLGSQQCRKLLSPEEQHIGDMYVIDSSVTGKQILEGFGRRFTVGQGAEEMMPPNNVKYIALEQGAFVTNSPVILEKPEIRDSVCGAAILRCGLAKEKRKRIRQEAVIERGEIRGMMHFADFQFKFSSKAGDYIMYADAFDPLVEARRSIIQEQEDRDTQEDEKADSPSKKRKAGPDGTE
jgi:hypothetical protein